MAVVESIPEKNQTPSAQKGVLDYCMQPSKTFDEDEQLAYISGYNCIPEQANESFLATQKIFGHEPDGVRFYHFVQSLKISYDMVWTPERKYITYICPTQDGKERKVRDIKLNDEKYLKENMEYEFRIRTELYGQAQGSEHSSGTARSDGRTGIGTGDSDGADQRRRMEQIMQNDTTDAKSVKGVDGTESRFEGISGELRHGDEEGDRSGSSQGDEGSNRTGWESERESFRGYRQKNSPGRGTVVAPSRSHGSPNAAGIALMDARGIANVGSIIEDDGEESEEEKREREARNAGEAVGAVVGFGIGAVVELTKQKQTPADDVDDGEDIEDWEEVQRKQREEEAERQRKEQEILATWFLREEYINAGWFKRLLLRIEFVFRDTRGESHIPQIPEHIRKEIARCLLPDIVAYFESEQGQREFEEWKAQQEAEKKSEVA